MAQFYTLEEAARVLGMSPEDLKLKAQHREVRAFMDSGSWQFRVPDVDELARRRGLGSDPDLSLSDMELDVPDGSGSEEFDLSEFQIGTDQADFGAKTGGHSTSGSHVDDEADVQFDDLTLPTGPLANSSSTIIGMKPAGKVPSDSDVRLVPDRPLKDASDSDVRLMPFESRSPGDSNVTLVTDDDESLPGINALGQSHVPAGGAHAGGVGSSAEIDAAEGDSGSDFELTPQSDIAAALQPESGSDFELTAIDASDEFEATPLAGPSDSDVTAALPSASGINLARPSDSGINLQGVGGAFLFANSSAILTDAFPENERGLALGINGVAAIGGSFIGLIVGGVLAPIEWRLVFLVCVPFGLLGTVWAYMKLVDNGVRIPSKIDWWGNVTFAVGLIALLTGIVYGIQPYGGHTMGWTNPGVLAAIFGGAATLLLFGWIERRVAQPMFHLPLFRIRAFAAGNIANLLGALGRGGLQFMLIIWLQGIWLPQHGYSFVSTPLWAGIYMIPLTVGFLVAGPVSGVLSDRYGARPFATGGMIGAAVAFGLLELLPMNFNYVWFALILLLMGLAMGLFSSPNRAGVMNSLPPDQRGAGAGMMTTFQNAAQVLSIGVFFTVITLGLAATLPTHLYSGLVAHGVPSAAAQTVAAEPPIGALFSAFLGFNPIQQLLPAPVLAHLSHAQAATLTGRGFFPSLISPAFATGLHYAFDFAIACSLIAAVASWLRGRRYVHGMDSGGMEGAAATATPDTHDLEADGSLPEPADERPAGTMVG